MSRRQRKDNPASVYVLYIVAATNLGLQATACIARAVGGAHERFAVIYPMQNYARIDLCK